MANELDGFGLAKCAKTPKVQTDRVESEHLPFTVHLVIPVLWLLGIWVRNVLWLVPVLWLGVGLVIDLGAVIPVLRFLFGTSRRLVH